jgi:predicted nucleic acid-binding protein
MSELSNVAPIRVYLDTCVFNRPFDDQTQPRIWLETLALSVIMQMIESRSVVLLSSSVLAYENSRNANVLGRDWIQRCIRLARRHQPVDRDIRNRAEEMERQGFKALDALHIASAEAAGADYFVTCDDRLMRRYRLQGGRLQVCNPVDFVREIAEE